MHIYIYILYIYKYKSMYECLLTENKKTHIYTYTHIRTQHTCTRGKGSAEGEVNSESVNDESSKDRRAHKNTTHNTKEMIY